MQTVVDRAVLLQQVSDFAVQQLLAELQARLEHLERARWRRWWRRGRWEAQRRAGTGAP